MSDDDEKPLTLYERARVVSWELEDATEDLNDRLREVERLLGEKGFGSCRVPIPPFEERKLGKSALITTHTLFWSGKKLVYEGKKERLPLLNAPRAARIRAVSAFPALWAELNR